jgi:hypothetical protein
MRARNPNSTVSDCGFCSATAEYFERPDRPLQGQKRLALPRDPPRTGVGCESIRVRRCAPGKDSLATGRFVPRRGGDGVGTAWSIRVSGSRRGSCCPHIPMVESRSAGAIRSERAAAEVGRKGRRDHRGISDVLRERLCRLRFASSGADRFANAVVRRAGFDVLPLERMSGQVDKLKRVTQSGRV